MTKTKTLRTALAASIGAAALIGAPGAFALAFDQNVTPNVIFGTGVTNGGFTTESASGVELGLRGKLRFNAAGNPENTFNSNGNGTYSFAAGVAPGQAPPVAEWSFEWSINSDFDGNGVNLAGLTYELGLDTDPSLAASFLTFDPIHDGNPGEGGEVRWDHAIGTNATPQSGGGIFVADEATYAGALSANNVAQNSWQPHWVFGPGFDPTVDATYDIYLAAFDSSGEVARSSIQIIVGQGGAAAVPAPATLALIGLGLLGLAVPRRRRAK